MDVYAIMNVVSVVCEQQHNYNEHIRKSLLLGIYDIADLYSEYINEHDDENRYQKSWNEIQLIKEFVEEGLQKDDISNIATAFLRIKDAAHRIG